jgi:beta-lactam-binding protein with PASTA domain
MNKRATGLGAVTLLVAGSIGLAGPAAAAESWAMPDVEGAILQEAHDDIASTTSGAVLPETTAADGTPYEQINLTNWVVCAQSPSAGEEISVDSPPELEVARPNGCE